MLVMVNNCLYCLYFGGLSDYFLYNYSIVCIGDLLQYNDVVYDAGGIDYLVHFLYNK